MASLVDPEKFWAALHKRAGICGHCGKKKCQGKRSHSTLPEKILLEDVTLAMKEAQEKIESVRNFDAVIFDVDGVLVDSLEAHLAFFKIEKKKYGLFVKVPNADKIKSMIRNGVKISPMEEFFLAFGFSENDAKRANQDYQDEFMKKCKPVPFDGVSRLLLDLSKAGVKLGIVSSNTLINVVESLGALRMSFFEGGLIHTYDNINHAHMPQTKSAQLKSLVKSLGGEPSRVLYVGDQPSDRKAATDAGVSFLGVTYGWGISPGDCENEAENIDDIREHVFEPDLNGYEIITPNRPD